MDAPKRIWQQFAALFRTMSPSQRLTLVAVPVVLLAAFGVLAWQGRMSSYVPLSWGKVFTIEELRSAEQTLIEAGLSEFRTEGQRILVPANKAEQYNAALLAGGNLPSNSMSEFEKQFEKSSVFTSREQLLAHKEIALQNELRKVLLALPDIEDARVIWAKSEARRWPALGGKVTATVSLRPRRGHPVQPSTVRSIRAAVASMVPDLSPDDVTVLDQSNARAFTADRDGDPFDDKLVRRIDEHIEHYRQRISQALAYIPGVIVSVNVDVENLKSKVAREQKIDAKQTVTVQSDERTTTSTTTERATAAEPGAQSNVPRALQTTAAPTRQASNEETDNSSKVVPSYTMTETEFLAAMPKAVQVAVSIPEDYYKSVALARGLTEGTTDAEKAAFKTQVDAIRKDEEEKAKAHAMTLIPSGSPEGSVHVTSVTRLEPEVAAVVIPWSERATQLVKQFGGTAALGLLALWGFWTLNRSVPKLPPVEEETPPSALAAEDEPEPPPGPPPTKRDMLQNFARDNPEAAAAVLSKWIQAAK